MYKIINKTISIVKETGISNFQILRVALFSIISFIFEIFGIGIFIPIINFVQDPNKDFFIFDDLIKKTSGYFDVYFIIFLLVLLIFLLKSFAFILYNYYLVSFWSNVNIKLTDRLYKIILNTTYKNNSLTVKKIACKNLNAELNEYVKKHKQLDDLTGKLIE